MGVIEIANLEQFNNALTDAGDKLVVVDFTATWCGPCKQLAPKFEAESTKAVNSNVIFLKVDVDDAEDVSAECSITCMPTFKFYKKGKLVAEFSGANEVKLLENLESLRT